MKAQFKDLGRSMGGFRCVSLPKDPKNDFIEDTLAGEHGEIWVKGVGTYKALIVLPTKSEKIITFNSKDLKKWVLRLKVPSDPALQAHWANNPNSR